MLCHMFLANFRPHACGLGLTLVVLLSSACDSESSSKKLSASASEPTAEKPSGMVIPVEEKPTAQAEAPAQKPKKTLEDCPKGNELEVEDSELEQAMRFKLQKQTGDLTKADLKRLTSLNLSQMKVHDLDICLFPHMTNLKELFLGPGDLDDLSPIENATKLESLRASLNKVEDIAPLSKMTNMERLDLG